MKRITTAVVLAAQLLTLAPAHAAYPTQDPPSQVGYQQSRVPKNRRVAVIVPSRWAIITAPQIQLALVANGFYHAVDMLQEQGCDVHYYSARIFEQYQYGSKLYRELGDYYQLAVVIGVGDGDAFRAKYVCPESTNVQLLCIGGLRSNGIGTWAQDTAVAGFVDRSANLESFSVTSSATNAVASKYSCLVPWTPAGLSPRDTIWGNNMQSGQRIGNTALAAMTGISSVVRVLQPIVAGNARSAAWTSNNSDSNQVWMPGSTATMGSTDLERKTPGVQDSVAREWEYLGPVWKVKWVSGREVWFCKLIAQLTSTIHAPAIIYACMARFVDVKPIKYGLDFDDVTDINDSANQPRWRNSAAESLLTAFDRFGLKVGSNGIDPGNAPGYVNGTTPSGESGVPWVGPAHSYIKRLTWTHHSHDSTNGRITSNLVGGYGGYPPSNGTPPTGSVGGSLHTGRRYASRWNPGATEADNWGAWGNFGIVQRLQYGDSVRNALGVIGNKPPYLTFPANQMLPINWRERNGVNWPGTAVYDSFYAVHGAQFVTPIDSVVWAFDWFLNNQKDCGLGKITLRSGSIALGGLRVEALWADRDSFVAQTIAQYPRDRWTTRIGSRLVQTEIIDCLNQGTTSRSGYLADAQPRAARWIGLWNRANKAESANLLLADSTNILQGGIRWYDYDMNKLLTAGFGRVNFPARQSTRIKYLHPSGLAGSKIPATAQSTTAYGDYATDQVLIGMHSYIRALDAIACKPVTVCVMPWEVYVK